MALTQIRGNTQIINETIENSQISATAAVAYSKLNLTGAIVNADLFGGIATGKLVDGLEFLKRDGSVALTGDLNLSSFKITGLAAGTAPTDAVTKAQLDTVEALIEPDTTILDRLVKRETPSGLVDSLNTEFTLAFTPEPDTEEVFLNGLLQDKGATADYTIVGAAITFGQAPHTTSKIRVSYIK